MAQGAVLLGWCGDSRVVLRRRGQPGASELTAVARALWRVGLRLFGSRAVLSCWSGGSVRTEWSQEGHNDGFCHKSLRRKLTGRRAARDAATPWAPGTCAGERRLLTAPTALPKADSLLEIRTGNRMHASGEKPSASACSGALGWEQQVPGHGRHSGKGESRPPGANCC